MSGDRFAADPERLRQSARRLRALQSRVQGLSSTVDQLANFADRPSPLERPVSRRFTHGSTCSRV